MTREITIVSTQGSGRVVLNSSATTWAELQSEINSQGTFNASDAQPLIRGGAAIESGSHVLPEGSFTLFITPSKIKSGL